MSDQQITHRLPEAGRKGRGQRVGFRDTYSHDVLLDDMASMVKLHLPLVEDWQAAELVYDLLIGVIESKYLVQR